jgi:Domain of unknown function (DUF1992)
MSPTHRTPDGDRQVGPTWESLIDRQIREAMERGEFDDLPHQGAPLPLEDDRLAGDRAMAFRMLREAGFAPPWIEADKEVRTLLARRDTLLQRARTTRAVDRSRLRAGYERLVRDINVAIERLNNEAPTERQQRVSLDPDAESQRLERAFPP